MRRGFASALLLLGLVACGKENAPTGQVVATVDGEEITTAELNAELNGVQAKDPAQQKLLQRQALQSIVNRMLLAKAVEDQNLDDTPAAALAERRAEQFAKIALLEQSIRAKVPKVSREEAEEFVNDNPQMFANRKIFMVEQITVPSPPKALIDALRPINTMTEVQAELAKYKVPNRIAFGVIDAITMRPDAAKQIAALPADAVFILPDNNAIRINKVRETQTQPVTGADAINIATEMLRSQRAERQISEEVARVLKAGSKSVTYNDQFKPLPAPAQRAPAKASDE